MTPTDRDRPALSPPALSPQDAALVRRISELSNAPEHTAAERVAFQAELDRRVARRPRRFSNPVWAGAIAVGFAAIVLIRLGAGGPADPTAAPTHDSSVGSAVSSVTSVELGSTSSDAEFGSSAEALLSLLSEDVQSDDDDLPAEYAAINSLLLGS